MIVAAKASQVLFEYLAHIQKDDGHTLELSGSREDENHNSVYQWLRERARELGGYLVSQRISESRDDDTPWIEEPLAPKAESTTPVRVEVPSVFRDTAVFGTFTNTYKGASLCTYKVTKE